MGIKLPRVTSAQMIRVLEKRGFELVRSSGSHRIYRNRAGIRATVPFHAGKILHPKIVSRIIDDIGMTAEELADEL